MKVKKFPQSHLVLEKDSKTLVIDPGYLTFEKGFKVEDFKGADVYLITHQHDDHLGSETIKEIVAEKPVLGNADVFQKLQSLGVPNAKKLNNMEEVDIEGFKIKAVDLPHFRSPGMVPPPNTGFLVDNIFFHPGDGDRAPAITSQNAALPIGGATITFDTALEFAQKIGARVIIPIHYDFYISDPFKFAEMGTRSGLDIRPLNPGEETEI